jgi:hypothetical protein
MTKIEIDTYEKINDLIKKGTIDAQKISDGYHTFEELYKHRNVLFVCLCRNFNSFKKILDDMIMYKPYDSPKVWKSLKHSDNSSYEGFFIMGIGQKKGEQISYHLPISYWEETEFAEIIEKAPDFDGHTSQDVAERIKSL